VVTLLASCIELPVEPPPALEPPEQGIVIGLRTTEQQPVVDGRGLLGGGHRALPDAQGFVYYFAVPPGRISVSFELPGAAVAHGAPEVLPGHLSVWTTLPLPLVPTEIVDPQSRASAQLDVLSVEIPEGSASASGPWTLGLEILDESERPHLPGALHALLDDDELTPVRLDWMAVARGWEADDEDVELDEDAPAQVTLSLPEGSPWLTEPPRVFSYSPSRTWWTSVGVALADAEARTLSFEVSSLGWWALGELEEEPRSCVRGRAVDPDGAPVAGAELRMYAEDTVGVARTTTSAQGAFCLPLDSATPAALELTGVASARRALYTWRGAAQGAPEPGTCDSGPCTELGDLPVERWPDADEDQAWSGPGGDCDDSAPDINPNPVLGDGSWCGTQL
jgi:hypothetical protein